MIDVGETGQMESRADIAGADLLPREAPQQQGRQFELGRLVRIEAAPIMMPTALVEELTGTMHLIGYHHCPSLCLCERAPLYVFGLDASPYHRGLAANILSAPDIRDKLDQYGALGWSGCANPPGPLRVGLWSHEDGELSEADPEQPDMEGDRRGWIVPVYGPYARKGFFLFEQGGAGPLPPLSARLKSGLADLHDAMSRKIAMMDRRAELTQREIDVTRWIVYGKSNPVIAEILDLSTHTVNGYLRRIYLKTGTADRVSLAIYAVNHGFV